MSLERNASRLGAVMIMEGSWFQAIIVRGKKENYRRRMMLILEYISTHFVWQIIMVSVRFRHRFYI